MPDLDTIDNRHRTVVDHRHRHQTTAATSIRSPVWTTTAPAGAQRHAGAVADDAAVRIVDGLVERFGGQLPRRVIGVLDRQRTADLLWTPPHRQHLLHPSTEHVVSVDPACTVAGAPLTGGPMRGRGPVAPERVGIAAQFAADRGRAPPQLRGDHPNRRTGTLASTVFALDAQTGRIRWQRYLPEGPQLIAMRISRAGVITLEAIILSSPCTGRPVSLDLDIRTGRELGRRNQLSFTRSVPAPPHGPVVAADGTNAYRVEAGSAGPVVRAVSAAGATRWQRAFPDPGDHFISVPNVVTGVVDHGGGLFVAGSGDYLGPRRCARP